LFAYCACDSDTLKELRKLELEATKGYLLTALEPIKKGL